jgi:DNA repair protein RadC
MNIWTDVDHVEKFYVLLMNRNNRVLGYKLVSMGGISGTVSDPKVIFQTALKANASCLILAHNHPSGNTDPSQADIALTHKMVECGKYLDLEVLDHLVVTSEGYYSFADEGKL